MSMKNVIAPLPTAKPSKARKAHSYRAARRNFARTIRAAGIGERWTHCTAFGRSPQSLPLREFVSANPKASKGEVLDFFRAMAAHKPAARPTAVLKADAEARQRGENLDGSERRETVAAEPVADAPKPKRTRKPAAPKTVAEAETPKAPRKRAAPKVADASAKPKAAPRRRSPAA